MAEAKAPKAPAKAPGGPPPKSGKAGKATKAPQGATDPSPKVVDGTPRLLTYYTQTVRPRLQQQLGLTNPMQIPRLVKIVLNVGLGEASKNPKALETLVDEIVTIAGQRPVVTRAKKAIANFGLRQGVPVGVMVTLRGPRMYELLGKDGEGLETIRKKGLDPLKKSKMTRASKDPREYFQWPLAFAVALLFAEMLVNERRRRTATA